MTRGGAPSETGFDVTLATPPRPGAIAVLQWSGPGAAEALSVLTGRDGWAIGRPRLCDLGGVDEGLACLLDATTAQATPHGGPRVVERLIETLVGLGGRYDAEPDPAALYPEAGSPIEADALAAIARAASPAAIDLLAGQREAWLGVLAQSATPCAAMGDGERDALLARSAALDRLIDPPAVVAVGPPNAGKSALANRLLGESASIVGDLPGTTRDWVGAVIELAAPPRDPRAADRRVAVRWLDTPGLRDPGGDAVERRAINAARGVVASAELVIAMRGPGQAWPPPDALPRPAGLWVFSRADQAPDTPGGDGSDPVAPLRVSAVTGEGLDALQRRVAEALGLGGLDAWVAEPWCFTETLRRYARGEHADLSSYLGVD